MTPNPSVRACRSARRRALAAGLVASAVLGGVATGASAAPSQAPPTIRPLPAFWDVGVGETRDLVDGQVIHLFAAAQRHDGGVSTFMCSGPYGAPGVICQPAGGPFFERNGFIYVDVKVTPVITDTRSGRRVDCRAQNSCHVALVPAGAPGDAYSQFVTFVPGSPPPPPPPTTAPTTAPPPPPTTSVATTTSTAPLPEPGSRPTPIPATPHYTG